MHLQETTLLQDYLPEKVEGKNILVTGGTAGIGRAIAKLLAACGANVFIVGRNQEHLDETLAQLKQENPGTNIYGIIADVSNNDNIHHIFTEVDKQFDRLDILVNNAAIAHQDVMDGEYADWEYVIKTNLLNYIACTHEAVKRMQANGGGHIINIGSMSADVREKGSSIYVATKSGIQGFSEALRKEVNEQGIKVSLIEPGAVGTNMQPASIEEQRQNQEELKMLKAEDIAAAVLYTLLQPKRCDIVNLQIRPHLQII